MHSSGTIYFIEAGDYRAMKIGWTDGRPETRLRACQTGCPELLHPIAEMPGGPADEKELHDAFADSWLIGEWFGDVSGVYGRIEREMEARAADVRGVFPAWRRAAERDRERLERRLAARAALAAKAAAMPSQGTLS